jgi:hypothetical protein
MNTLTTPDLRSQHPATTIEFRGWLEKYFYFAMSLLIAAIVVWGFSHTIDANLFHGAPPRPLLLWIHGAAFSLWVAFYIFQSALVRTRNVRVIVSSAVRRRARVRHGRARLRHRRHHGPLRQAHPPHPGH